MRQYPVILIALLVLFGGLVARSYLGTAATTATTTRAEVQARALASAEALAEALGGPATPEALAPRLTAVDGDCAALEATGATPACTTLRSATVALRTGVDAASVQQVQDAIAALRAEPHP